MHWNWINLDFPKKFKTFRYFLIMFKQNKISHVFMFDLVKIYVMFFYFKRRLAQRLYFIKQSRTLSSIINRWSCLNPYTPVFQVTEEIMEMEIISVISGESSWHFPLLLSFPWDVSESSGCTKTQVYAISIRLIVIVDWVMVLFVVIMLKTFQRKPVPCFHFIPLW